MGLLSINISKVKKLSLKEVKLCVLEIGQEGYIKPIQAEKPPTDEEIAFSNIVALNPLILDLVARLNLVSCKTGEPIRKIEVKEEYNFHLEPAIKVQTGDNNKLLSLALKIIKGEFSYTKEDIVTRLKEVTNVNQERAERGFTVMLQTGIIEQTINLELYFLGGSTPF